MSKGVTLNWDVSQIYLKNYSSQSDIVINRGGTSSGKTYSLIQLFLTILITEPEKRILISRKYNNTMELTVLADFWSLCKSSGIYQNCIHHKSKKTLLYPPTGSIIYYTGLDEAQKLKGTNFNYVWLNEADEFTYEQFTQLYLRLRKPSVDGKRNKIYLDFNPSDSQTWIRLKLEDLNKGDVIHSTYLDNPFLDADTVRKIKNLQDTDEDFFSIYGLGLYTSIKGLIYKNFEIVDYFPQEVKWWALGLDFGFTNDSTAVPKVGFLNGELWIDELIYSTGLLNSDIIKKLRDNNISSNREIFADSAAPKDIEEIRRARFNIKGVKKIKGSVKWGIGIIKQRNMNIVKTATNIIKEVRAYKWKTDKRTGESLNEPIDKFNHALDAIRYVAMEKIGDNAGGLKWSKSR